MIKKHWEESEEWPGQEWEKGGRDVQKNTDCVKESAAFYSCVVVLS